MKKEDWLEPISKEDVAKFAYEHMNIVKITELSQNDDFSYGKFFQVGGFINEDILSSWGKTNKYMNPMCFGAYGPVTLTYKEDTVDDLMQLFGGDENKINIFLSWVSLVAEKNAGRKIDGKTYLESFSNACNNCIDLIKSAQIRTIESEANEKKQCVSSFVSQLSKAESGEEKQPQNK